MSFVSCELFFSVTIFGESAGGASATYLMMSPLAKGKCENKNCDEKHFLCFSTKHFTSHLILRKQCIRFALKHFFKQFGRLIF